MIGRTTIMSALLACVFALGARGAATQTQEEADGLYQARKWEEAAKAYGAITKSEPANGRAWYRLGFALDSLGRYAEGAEALRKAVDIGHRPEAMYELARSYALLKDKDRAFEWLNEALEKNLPQPLRVRDDQNLAYLRDDPRFQGLLALAERKAHVCMNAPEYRQFDFWIGEWEVRNTAGQAGAGDAVASSSIQRIIESCVVYENYSEGDDFLGKSFNFYDAALRKWRQTWVDNTGRVSEFTGEYREGAMRFEGESHLPDGSKVLRHMTLFNLGPDRVRQLSEASTDGGKTWQVTYDFTYVRKK